MKQVTLNVDDEVASIVDTGIKEYQDIKSSAGLSIEIADALPMIAVVGANYAKLSADAKSPDDWAYLVKQVMGVIFPAPAAPAA
jgi:hypothetical protein